MKQKDQDRLTRKIEAMSLQKRSDVLFFLIGYCDEQPNLFWEGVAICVNTNSL